MGLQDFASKVLAGKGVEAITKEANRVSGNLGKKADGIGETLSLGKKYVGYHKGEPERDYSNSSMDDYFKKLL